MPDDPVGPWGMFKALRDPDVQRVVGVGLPVVKRYGQTFDRSEISPPQKTPRRGEWSMHELSLANQLIHVAEETAREAGASSVTVVRLRVGDLSGVSVDALRFAYDVATAGTVLEGSRLEVRTVAVRVYCPRCEREVELPSVQSFRCPACDTPTGDVRAGRELEIESLEVD